jgi:hypothetical protein
MRKDGLRPQQQQQSSSTSLKHIPRGSKKKRLFAFVFVGVLLFLCLLLVGSMMMMMMMPTALFVELPLDHHPQTQLVQEEVEESHAVKETSQDQPLPRAVAVETKQKKYPNSDNNNNNNIAAVLPPWMTDYFQWHATARHSLQTNPETWKSFRYLMLQCLPKSLKCGGTADRLQPLPLLLWMAHHSSPKRILLIKWGRPAELEAFLLPPIGGMDWRVPDWLYAQQEFRQGPRATNVEELQQIMTANPDYTMVKARIQTHDHGSQFYNTHCRRGTNNTTNDNNDIEPTFELVFHLCWRVVFTPSPPVAQLIEQQLQESGLVPGQYVGIHVRALYAVKDRDPNLIHLWTRNAINCASQLAVQVPTTTTTTWTEGRPFFYLSSDSSHAIAVGKEYSKERQVQVASRRTTGEGLEQQQQQQQQQPYHLDKAPKSAQVSDFYDTFVDLYLLSLSRCITYNMGGFGTFALYMSPYAHGSCSFQHHEASGIHRCEWLPGSTRDNGFLSTKPIAVTTTTTSNQRTTPLFLPPMT